LNAHKVSLGDFEAQILAKIPARQRPPCVLYPVVMQLITTTEALAGLCSRLAAHDFVAVDTEFMRESTFWPILCLIQLAGPDEEAVVDPMADGIDLAPFFTLMADRSVTKVFHAARQDVEIIYIKAKIVPVPLFDSQVAAMVCGFGESISYVNLVKQLVGADIDKTSRFTDWSRRPLSTKQLDYALGDVTHLRGVYAKLKAELETSERAHWLEEEMSTLLDPGSYMTQPEDAWKRLKLKVRGRKGLAVLMELAAWRERLAHAQDVPRARILRDDALYDIANHAPTETAKLSELRTLSDGFARSGRAKEIVEAVKTGLARDFKTLPSVDQTPPVPPDKLALVELLRVLLKACAARNRVAPRLIADAEELERLATERDPDLAVLKGWRRELFGEDALRLKRGELALSVKDGEVVAVAVPPSA
jgi:ribonuclease D